MLRAWLDSTWVKIHALEKSCVNSLVKPWVIRTSGFRSLLSNVASSAAAAFNQHMRFAPGFRCPNRIMCVAHIQSFLQVYVVKVQCNTAHSWVSEKRYSDFLSFDEKLRKKFWYMEVPKLPEKEVWNFSKNTDEFLLARQKQLQTYMSTVLKTSCFSQADETWQFLTDSKTIVGVPPEALMEAAAADGSKGATNYGAIGAGGAAVAAH